MSNADKKVSTRELISKTVTKLADRAEREVAEFGPFKPVKEDFKINDKSLYVGKVSVKVSPSTLKTLPDYQKTRYVEAAVSSPSGVSTASQMLGLGTKQQILDLLKQDSFGDKVEEFIETASKKLRENEYK